jgi:hypothetical protein
LDFINPEGSPDVFKGLIDYLDKVISLLICGENEAGQAESGSRASSMVANVVRVVRASEVSEMICHQLTQTLVRWIVDLNFGADVASPTLTREFRIEESQLTPADVSLLIQNGFKPRREWIERHFRVDLEDEAKSAEGQQGSEGETTFDPEKDKNLYESIFGPEDGSGGDAEGAPGSTAEMTPDEVAPDEEAPDGGIQGEETPDDTTPTEETPTKQPPVEKRPKKRNSKANKELDPLLSELDSALAEEPGESEPGELPEEEANETESTSGISGKEIDSIISEMENKVKGKK